MFNFILLIFLGLAYASPDTKIYVDLSSVILDDKKGTSQELNTLVGIYSGVHRSFLKNRLTARVAPDIYDGSIDIYTLENIHHISKKKCDYISGSLRCGIDNSHWIIRTHVTVGKKFSTLNMILYDEKGKQIGHSTDIIWGTIRYTPRWKHTTIKENTMFGQSKKEILERYPPKIDELPPLITPNHVSNAIMMLFLSVR